MREQAGAYTLWAQLTAYSLPLLPSQAGSRIAQDTVRLFWYSEKLWQDWPKGIFPTPLLSLSSQAEAALSMAPRAVWVITPHQAAYTTPSVTLTCTSATEEWQCGVHQCGSTRR